MFVLLPEKWERALFVGMVVLMVYALMYPHYLPMLDLPQHATQIALLDNILKGKSLWTDWVELNWDTPYLLVYSIWLLVYQFSDIALSSKLMVVGIFLCYLWSMILLRKSFQAARIMDWGALTCFFGFAFQFGLISYLGAIPVGILFFLANKRFLTQQNTADLVWILFLGILAYLSHVLIFAFFCFLSYAYFLCRSLDKSKRLTWKKALVFSLPYLIFALIFIRYISKPSLFAFQYYSVNFEYPSIWYKTQELFYLPWNMFLLAYYDLAFTAMFVLPPLLGFKLSKNPEKYLFLLGFLVIWYALPDRGFQTGFVYQRFAIFLVPFYYLLWEKPTGLLSTKRQSMAQISSLVMMIAVVSLLFKVWDNNVKFHNAAATRDFHRVVQQMQAGKKVLGLFESSLRGSGELTSDMEYLYFANWYQAEKAGWADFNFAVFHPQIVRFKPEKLAADYGKHRGMNEESLLGINCADYDYLLMRTKQPVANIQQILVKNPTCQNWQAEIETAEWLVFAK